jgi:protein-S-isoprenylcysteine O-methyltransferase Ste14
VRSGFLVFGDDSYAAAGEEGQQVSKTVFGTATEFEFRHRVLIGVFIYLATYALYGVDRINVVWAFFHWDTPETKLYGRLAFGLAGIICAAGAGLWTWAAAYLPLDLSSESAAKGPIPIQEGPYRYVRHPLYAGSLLLTVGFGFFQSRLGFPLMILFFFVFVSRLIAREDARFANGSAVPALLTAFPSPRAAAAAAPHWRQALIRTFVVWGLVVTVVAFVISMNDTVGTRFGEATIVVWLVESLTRRIGQRFMAVSALPSKHAPETQGSSEK